MSFLHHLSLSQPRFNISYHSIPFVWLLAMYASTRGATRRLGFRDNVSPRENIAKMEASGKISPRVIAKVKRREAAHQNALEGLIPFIGSVVAGNQVGLSTAYMNGMVITYFIARSVYFYLYLNVTEQRYSWFRSIAWWVSNLCFLTTFWVAGNLLNQGPLKL